MGYFVEAIMTIEPGATLPAALAARSQPDPELTAALVAHAHRELDLTPAGQIDLDTGTDPSHTNNIHAGVWPGISILSSPELPLEDHPSRLGLSRVTHPDAGRNVLAVYSSDSVGAGGFALWDPTGRLVRALSIEGSPSQHRLLEDFGDRLPEEQPWWDDPDGYPPTLVKLVMLAHAGFDIDHEGPDPAPVDTHAIPLLAFSTTQRDTPRPPTAPGPPTLQLRPPAATPPQPAQSRRSWWRRRG